MRSHSILEDGKRSLVRIVLHEAMYQSLGNSKVVLEPLEARILRLVKPGSLKEKQIAKALGVDPMVLDPVITGLILKGYLEILRKRRFYFFSRELCAITFDGIAALDQYGDPVQNLLKFVRDRAEAAVGSLVSGSSVLRTLAFAVRALLRVAKAIV